MSRLRRAYAYVHSRTKLHRPLQLAAQVAFYFLLATQPLLIVLTSLLAYLPLHHLEPRIAHFVVDAFPGPTGEQLASVITGVFQQRNPGLLSGAVIGLLWTASSGTKAVIDAMTRIRGLAMDPRRWIHVRLRATALTIVNIVLIAIGGSLAGGVVDLVQRQLATDALFAYHRWVELVLGLALMTAGTAVVYRFGPPPPRYPSVPGAIVAMLALVAASFGLTTYLRHARDLNAIYGSLGALVLLMLWFYVVGGALVLGAEVNVALYEWRNGQPAGAETGTAMSRERPVGRHALSSAS